MTGPGPETLSGSQEIRLFMSAEVTATRLINADREPQNWLINPSIKMIGVGWGTVKAMSYPARIFMERRVTVLLRPSPTRANRSDTKRAWPRRQATQARPCQARKCTP